MSWSRQVRSRERGHCLLVDLYPPIEPHASGFLHPDGHHALYWEECGNPNGTPVLFLHGGPGSGCSPRHRRFFNPRYYRILLMDQRGAGRSTPHGDILNNTPAHLIQDLELLRRERGIAAWHLFGGSWGSTLALAYAESHPQVCLSLTLRGIFMMRRSEIAWFFGGMRQFAPEAWQAFHDFLPTELRADLCEGYWSQLNHHDPAIRIAAAKSWAAYEARCLMLGGGSDQTNEAQDPFGAIALARLEAHYMRSNRFSPDDKLLRYVALIRHLPCTIVHGRRDLLCPPANAYDLHAAWPESQLQIVDDAGHSAWEPGTIAALVTAMNDRMRAPTPKQQL